MISLLSAKLLGGFAITDNHPDTGQWSHQGSLRLLRGWGQEGPSPPCGERGSGAREEGKLPNVTAKKAQGTPHPPAIPGRPESVSSLLRPQPSRLRPPLGKSPRPPCPHLLPLTPHSFHPSPWHLASVQKKLKDPNAK